MELLNNKAYQYLFSICHLLEVKSRIATEIRGFQRMKMTMVNSGLKGFYLLKSSEKNFLSNFAKFSVSSPHDWENGVWQSSWK